VTSRDRVSRVKYLTRILRSFYLVKLGNLPNSRIKIERVNSIELKLNLTIILVFINVMFIEFVIKQLFKSLVIKFVNCLYNCNINLL